LFSGDVVSAVTFDEEGEFIAVGDRGGRVMLYESDQPGTSAAQDSSGSSGKSSSKRSKLPEYRFYTEFQSHEPEFDYLKSLEIEEKINKISFCKRHNSALFLLSTNDKTVKLWKVYERKVRQLTNKNNITASQTVKDAADIKIPQLNVRDTVVAAVPRRTFANAHAYHINSISLNSDGETFVSSDDLRINLWNMEISDQSFNIVDIKPANMEELTEVITTAEFHPQHCNIFMYSSSKGTIKLADMRASALCDSSAKVFEEEEDPSSKSFFSEIISSISDVAFSADGRYVLARDYMTLKVWDINMDSKPVKSVNIHDHLRSKLCDLYENDCIFDKFECAMSQNGNFLLTGSYNNQFSVHDHTNDRSCHLDAAKSQSSSSSSKAGKRGKKGKKSKDAINPDSLDFSKKILHTAWHPTTDVLAVGAGQNVYLFANH
jgi:serine/threonine-protein phosphatase 2A regulatory subunit B